MISNNSEQHTKIEEIQFNSELQYFFKEKKKERQGICILIVDDQLFSRQLLVEALRVKWNYETIATKTMAQAISAYIENAPDIVFLDNDLPNNNSHKTLRKIKEIDKESFVVITSTNTSLEIVQAAIADGANGFIAKPLTKPKIEQYFNIYLEKLNKNK